MFYVRRMTVEDFTFAVKIADTMNWGLAVEDFEFMMKLEAEGCFTLLNDSERVGIATTISYGKIGWLGNVIIDEKSRGKGGGSILVKHSVDFLIGKGAKTIGIYGYLERIPFYSKQGFKFDSEYLVLKGRGFSVSPSSRIDEATWDDFQRIINLDQLYFGVSRRKLLESIFNGSGNLCYVYKDKGEIVGFIMVKVFSEMAEVGPLVCIRHSGGAAISLLRMALSKLGGLEVSIYVPKKETKILKVLKEFGFKEEFSLARMFHGSPIVSDYVYVAEALERG